MDADTAVPFGTEAAADLAAAPELEPAVHSAEVTLAEAPGEAEPAHDRGRERLSMRFSELTAQRNAERSRAEIAEREAAELRALVGSRQPEGEGVAFDPYDPAHVQEVIGQAVQQQLQAERHDLARRDAVAAQAGQARALASKLFESGLEGAVLIASGADIPFTQAMIDALSVSERAPQVADHLGRNPGEAARIARLPPSSQGYELARLESRLASQPRTTSAAPPYAPVGTRGGAAAGLRDDLPIDDWMRLERERRRR